MGSWTLDRAEKKRPYEAFENESVPDAFGLQLLGHGYGGRVPAGSDWQVITLDRDHVLVEHVDPTSWFAKEFAPRATATVESQSSVPDVLARARRDFSPILFTDAVREIGQR